MLNFDGGIEGHVRKFFVKGTSNAQGMGGTIPEIGIAKGDMACAQSNLLTYIGQHDLLRNGEEAPGIDRGEWAVSTSMFAATCGFGITGHREFILPLQRGIAA